MQNCWTRIMKSHSHDSNHALLQSPFRYSSSSRRGSLVGLAMGNGVSAVTGGGGTVGKELWESIEFWDSLFCGECSYSDLIF